MKKTIIVLSLLICIGSYAITNNAQPKNDNIIEYSSWQEYTRVYTLAKKSGSMWITNTNRSGHSVEQNSNGQFRINYQGRYYSISYSGIDKYPYKFNASNGTWYFDM